MRYIALLLFALVMAGCERVESSGGYTLSWTLPTENVDGSALDDLAGINVYEVTCPGTIDATFSESPSDGAQITLDATCSEPWERVEIASTGPTETSYSGVTTPGWHYWAVTSFDTSGNESALSNVGGKNVLDQLFPRPPVLEVE